MRPSVLPLVSVVIPAWNAAATLGETLRSVAAQSYAPLEIIIVDDGSEDSSAEIAAAFCASEPRARLLRQENGGVAAARNHGITEARGEWVAPLDADDLWHPTKIEKQVAAALSANEPPGFVYCWYHYVDTDSQVIGSRRAWVTQGHALRQLAYENFVGNGSGPLFRRSALVSAGGYDSSLRQRGAQGCEDMLLQLLIASSWPVAAVPEYLVGYRIRPDSMSRDLAQMRRSWVLAFAILKGKGVAIPPFVVRWAVGIEMLGFGAHSAVQGNWREASPLIAKAFASDPVRCSLHVLYRLCRLAVRKWRGGLTRPRLESFQATDPTNYVEPDADVIPGLAKLLRRLDERRLAKLRTSERQMA